MELISDLGLEGINGKARKSGRPSPSRWNSMRLGIMLIIALSFAVVVSGDTIPDPEDWFSLSGWKNVTFDDSYATIDQIQPGADSKGPLSVASFGFFDTFFDSFYGILLLELGDQTFFIAAILAMRHSRLVVFAGAFAALGLMTLMSTVFGYAATVIPTEGTYFLSNYISSVLFFLVAGKMLKDGYRMSPDEGQEVHVTIPRHDEGNNDVESQVPPVVNERDNLPSCFRSRCIVFSLIFLQAFAMTFLAEWGDRSQIATLFLLVSGRNVAGVCIGALLAHCFCTGLAVEGGRKVATKISVRLVTIIGGVVFYTLAVTSAFKGVEFKMMSDLQRLRKDDS